MNLKMKQFEYHYSDGSIYLTDTCTLMDDKDKKPGYTYVLNADLVVDHLNKTVIKNRYGQHGTAAYSELFGSEICFKESPGVAAVKAAKKAKLHDLAVEELNRYSSLDEAFSLPARIKGLIEHYKSLSELYVEATNGK